MNALLEQNFRFTAEDLVANRQGRLTVAQADRVAKTARIYALATKVMLGLFALTALGLLGYALLSPAPGTGRPDPFLLAFAAALVVVAVIAGIVVRGRLQKLGDTTVIRIEGPVALHEKAVSNVVTMYTANIAGQTLHLTPEQFAALENGSTYRFFAVHNGRMPLLLSVERL